MKYVGSWGIVAPVDDICNIFFKRKKDGAYVYVYTGKKSMSYEFFFSVEPGTMLMSVRDVLDTSTVNELLSITNNMLREEFVNKKLRPRFVMNISAEEWLSKDSQGIMLGLKALGIDAVVEREVFESQQQGYEISRADLFGELSKWNI